MTFYQELKEFFKKNDPQRLYMAKAIAAKFRKGSEQKVVRNRLEIIYNTGGPENIVIEDRSIVAPVIEETVVNNEENVDSTSDENVAVDIEIEGDSPDIEIELPGDDK